MTTSMLAAVLPVHGAPLQIEEIPIPSPRRGEVLVQVAACGVCHTVWDAKTRCPLREISDLQAGG
jgi:Zn-dependent alcohol dehydrogenase